MAVEIRHSGETVTVRSQRGAVTARSPSYSVEAVSGVLVGHGAYDGAYDVTPSEDAQVLPTSGLLMRGDVTVAPIPPNYGLITWDGTKIRVS